MENLSSRERAVCCLRVSSRKLVKTRKRQAVFKGEKEREG